MNINSIIPYYPTYQILDNIISEDKKFINLFIDLKACATGLFVKDIISEIIDNTDISNTIDTSIFSSLLFMLIYHKKYSLKKNKKIRFLIFSEMGGSYYHKNIFKKYKANRHINDFYLLDMASMEKLNNIVKKNILLMEKFLNKFPNVYYFNMRNLEADFIPYFLIKYTNISKDDFFVNIIYSSDHDMKQCLSLPNTKIYQRKRNSNNILSEGMAIQSEIKNKKKYDRIDDKYFPLFLSIVGDSSDEIPGINGIGPARCIKILPDVIKIFGDIEDIEKNIMENGNLKSHSDDVKNKVIDEDIIVRNLKLISFNILSQKILNSSKEYFANNKKYIKSILKKEEILNPDNIIELLIKMNIDFYEDDIYYLFE